MSSIPGAGRILLIGRDIRIRARLEAIASLPGGVDAVAPESLPADLKPYAVAVIDLDEAGVEPVSGLLAAGFGGRIVGFFSHVDEELGRRAQRAGAEVFRRGRFWRDASSILG